MRAGDEISYLRPSRTISIPNCAITSIVILTNGFETVPPSRTTDIGESANAETISNAESIWLDALASIETSPPFSPQVRTTNGNEFSAPRNSNCAPCDFSAFISPAIGRARIASSPSNLYLPPFLSATSAVIKRAAVPALPTFSSATELGICPISDSISIVFSYLSRFTTYPSFVRQSAIISVSREKSAPSRRVLPPSSAASSIARFVMLFDPGGRIDAAHLNVKGFTTIS